MGIKTIGIKALTCDRCGCLLREFQMWPYIQTPGGVYCPECGYIKDEITEKEYDEMCSSRKQLIECQYDVEERNGNYEIE